MSTTMHQLKIFPVPFASEPAEIVDIPEGVILGEWLAENVRNFDPDAKGVEASIPYDSTVLGDVYLYAAPPEGSAISSILSPVLKLLGLAPTKPKTPQQQVRGSELELVTVEANTAKYGQTVREAFGRNRIFPDYLSPRRRYFQNARQHWMEMLLCVGVGDYDIPLPSIAFGSTPVISMGPNAFAQVIPPGGTIPAPFNEWWHTAPEVGSTSTGEGGLPLKTIFPATENAPSGVYQLAGKVITPQSGQSFPGNWAPGMFLTLESYQTYTVSGSTLYGDFSGLQVTAGDTVTLGGDYSGSWLVTNYTPSSGGGSGSASVWSAAAPPSLTYEEDPVQFSVTAGTLVGTFSISQDFMDQSDLIGYLNSALSETALNGAVEFRSGLQVVELPPFAGRRITVTDISGASRMFGPLATANAGTLVGQPAYPGSGASLTLSGFVAESPTASLSIAKEGERFVITGASTSVVTVDRVPDGWDGWTTPITTQDISLRLSPDSATGGWAGPFTPVPSGETATAFEFDIFYPQGLIHYNRKGRQERITASGAVQWRYIGGTSWNTVWFSHSDATPDQLGFTYRVNLPTSGRIEVRARRDPKLGWANTNEDIQWFGLRALLVGGKSVYPEFTCVLVRVQGSGAMATLADEMLSVVATRKLDGVPERRISKAVEHIARRASVNTAELIRLESDAWTPRGDTFDFSFEKPATIKQAVNTALSVGFADFTLEDGVMKPVREALIDPQLIHVYRQTFSARNTLKGSIRSTYELFSDDETDCIDVKYIDSRTWRVEIVRCKEGDPNEPPRKVEEMEADGISDRDKAFQWGMRKLMEIKTESTRHRCKTELDALNCGYGSYVNFVREMPGWSQSSRVKIAAGLVLTTVDRLDWQEGGDHVVALRRPDGTMSEIQSAERVGDDSMMVPALWSFTPTPIETNVFFGIRQRFATPAIVRQVKPAGMTVDVSAIGYNPEKYQYDDAEANN